jgi:dTDP-glucose 4,6-dehydratase
MVNKIVILGGGGSFGINTALYFLANSDAEVIGIGRNLLRGEAWTLGIETEPRFKYRAFHTTYELDLLLEFLDVEKPDIIINYAAQGEGAVSWKHSWRFFETNSMGLVRLAEALNTRHYVKRFIHIGTSEMYGSVTEPASETAPIMPTSPYAASKVAFDLYLLAQYRVNGFPFNIIRPSNCYCPGQLLHRIIPRTILFGLIGRKIKLEGGGNAEKSYLHAGDLAHAIHFVMNSGTPGQVYNVGPPLPIKIRSVVQHCAEALGIPFDDLAEEAPDRPGQDGRYWLDSSKIKELGWSQKIYWDDGLSTMVDWGRQFLPQLREAQKDYQLRG